MNEDAVRSVEGAKYDGIGIKSHQKSQAAVRSDGLKRVRAAGAGKPGGPEDIVSVSRAGSRALSDKIHQPANAGMEAYEGPARAALFSEALKQSIKACGPREYKRAESRSDESYDTRSMDDMGEAHLSAPGSPEPKSSETSQGPKASAQFELQDTQSVATMASVRSYNGPNGLVALDIEPGRLLPIGFDGLRDRNALNRRASIAGLFNEQLGNIRVTDIQNTGSGQLTLSDGTRVPYNQCQYTVNNNGNSESYDAVLAQVRTGNMFRGTTHWIILANRAGQLDMNHVNDFARSFDPRTGFSQ